MDEWITAIKKVSSKEYYESDPRRNFHMDVQGNHSWYVTNHARPTFCNVCHNALGSVMNNGLSCEGKSHYIFGQKNFRSKIFISRICDTYSASFTLTKTIFLNDDPVESRFLAVNMLSIFIF